MKVRFQADNDLRRAIVGGVLRRLPTADFQSQPLNDVDDLAVLHMAAEAARIVVSHDVSTMPQAFADFRRTSHSPGVLLTRQFTECDEHGIAFIIVSAVPIAKANARGRATLLHFTDSIR